MSTLKRSRTRPSRQKPHDLFLQCQIHVPPLCPASRPSPSLPRRCCKGRRPPSLGHALSGETRRGSRCLHVSRRDCRGLVPSVAAMCRDPFRLREPGKVGMRTRMKGKSELGEEGGTTFNGVGEVARCNDALAGESCFSPVCRWAVRGWPRATASREVLFGDEEVHVGYAEERQRGMGSGGLGRRACVSSWKSSRAESRRASRSSSAIDLRWDEQFSATPSPKLIKLQANFPRLSS